MTQLPEKIYPEQVPEDDRNFEPIPAGTYKLQVIESRLQETSTGSGEMLVLTLEVVEGQYQGRRIWDRLNIRNDSADAQRIAQRALADLCLQLGVSPLEDSEQLHFHPFMGRVTIVPDRSGQYGPSNRVRYNVNLPDAGSTKSTPQPQGRPQQGRAQQPQGRPQQTRPGPAGRGGGGPSKPWVNNQGNKASGKEMDDDAPPF